MAGFGARIAFDRSYNINYFHTGINFVNDYIWYGSPFDSSIFVFDKEGGLKRRLLQGSKTFNRLKPEMLADLNSGDEIREILREKEAIKFIHPIGKLVLVQLGNSFDIYDYHGNLLRLGVQGSFIGNIASVNDESFASEIPSNIFKELQKKHPLLEDAALKVVEGDNPIVLIYKFKGMQ